MLTSRLPWTATTLPGRSRPDRPLLGSFPNHPRDSSSLMDRRNCHSFSARSRTSRALRSSHQWDIIVWTRVPRNDLGVSYFLPVSKAPQETHSEVEPVTQFRREHQRVVVVKSADGYRVVSQHAMVSDIHNAG